MTTRAGGLFHLFPVLEVPPDAELASAGRSGGRGYVGRSDLAGVGVINDQAGGATAAAGRLAQIGVVQNVLERSHKLEYSEFLQVHRLLQAGVEQDITRALDDAAAGIAEIAAGRGGEYRRIEPLIHRVGQRDGAVDVGDRKS